MKRIFTFIFTAGMALVLLFPSEGECRPKSNLCEMLSRKSVVKTYVADISDSSGKAKADLKHLKKALEDALVTRMTIHFELVPAKENADIIIEGDITEFFYTTEDPIDMIGSSVTLIMDVLSKANYVRMQAIFTVTDAATNKQLWREKIRSTVTNETMTEQQSVPTANARIVKIFMRDCFSKANSRSKM
ncbi:MAG: hypothetical protein ABID83_06215 [Candidatus Omnitrophota bacterium]